MLDLEFTPRNVVKFVATAIVATKAESFTEDVITNHTRFDEDAKIVDVVGTVVGWYISRKVKPLTDAAIDKAADWYIERKAEKQNATQ